ncbi:hypothetical protein ACFLZ7_00725 [Nanoarchaeota archaeon]
MTKIHVATDQHYIDSMERMLKQFGFNKSYHFLGDITPHYETKDDETNLKARVNEIKEKYPRASGNQVYDHMITDDIGRALEDYEKIPRNTARRIGFIEENKSNSVVSISGNTDLIFHGMLETLSDVTGIGTPTNLDLLRGTKAIKFQYKEPLHWGWDESTNIYEIPFSEDEFSTKRLADLFSSSVHRYRNHLILTHENPHPEGVGIKREVKMQKTLDSFIDTIRDANKNSNIALACGHLHVSGDPYEYRGITIVPIAPDEVMKYDTKKGDFKVVKADNM